MLAKERRSPVPWRHSVDGPWSWTLKSLLVLGVAATVLTDASRQGVFGRHRISQGAF